MAEKQRTAQSDPFEKVGVIEACSVTRTDRLLSIVLDNNPRTMKDLTVKIAALLELKKRADLSSVLDSGLNESTLALIGSIYASDSQVQKAAVELVLKTNIPANLQDNVAEALTTVKLRDFNQAIHFTVIRNTDLYGSWQKPLENLLASLSPKEQDLLLKAFLRQPNGSNVILSDDMLNSRGEQIAQFALRGRLLICESQKETPQRKYEALASIAAVAVNNASQTIQQQAMNFIIAIMRSEPFVYTTELTKQNRSSSQILSDLVISIGITDTADNERFERLMLAVKDAHPETRKQIFHAFEKRFELSGDSSLIADKAARLAALLRRFSELGIEEARATLERIANTNDQKIHPLVVSACKNELQQIQG